MKPGETAIRSPLDKPLGELTEEDISQLTREDCRRYLKEKGMRRPSWNKSQAIQQVISLKTLLETRADSADASDAIRLKVASVAPEPENLTQMESASPDESTSDRTKDPLPSSVAVDASCQIPATANGPFRLETSISPRSDSLLCAVVNFVVFFPIPVANVRRNRTRRFGVVKPNKWSRSTITEPSGAC